MAQETSNTQWPGEAKYFAVLGLPLHANQAAIKKAFREKAKLLHPDRNSSPNAVREFILLYEAYDYLYNRKTTRTHSRTRTTYNGQKTATGREADSHEKARRAAEMRYEAFIKSNLYKEYLGVNFLLNIVFAVFLVAVLVVLPVVAFLTGTDVSILFLPVVVILFWPLWKILYKSQTSASATQYFSAVRYVLSKPKFWLWMGAAFNCILFIYILLHVLIKPLELVFIYAISFLTGWLLSTLFRKKIKPTWRRLLARVIGPTLTTVVIMLNVLSAENLQKECYRFVAGREGAQKETTLILLEGRAYEAYPGVRFFMEMNDLQGNTRVCLWIGEGPAGIRVLKRYKFLNI